MGHASSYAVDPGEHPTRPIISSSTYPKHAKRSGGSRGGTSTARSTRYRMDPDLRRTRRRGQGVPGADREYCGAETRNLVDDARNREMEYRRRAIDAAVEYYNVALRKSDRAFVPGTAFRTGAASSTRGRSRPSWTPPWTSG